VAIQLVHGILGVVTLVETDESEASGLLGSMISGNVDVADVAKLFKHFLQLLPGCSESQIIHLERGHLVDVRRWTVVTRHLRRVRVVVLLLILWAKTESL